MKTLYDQVKEETRVLIAVGALLDVDINSSGFKISLRDIPALPEPFTAGQVCNAWLVYKLDYLNRIE